MRLYGLATRGEVVEWHLSFEQAADALRDVLTDEPHWRGRMSIIEVDFAEETAATVLL